MFKGTTGAGGTETLLGTANKRGKGGTSKKEAHDLGRIRLPGCAKGSGDLFKGKPHSIKKKKKRKKGKKKKITPFQAAGAGFEANTPSLHEKRERKPRKKKRRLQVKK